MNEPTTQTEFSEPLTHNDVPVAAPLRSLDPFAVGTDGRFFINVNVLDEISPAFLAGRPLFIGAELTHDETRLAREIIDNAAHELRARIAGALLKPRAPTSGEAPLNARAPTSDVREAVGPDAHEAAVDACA